jgi:hydrogenase nickel incorporation protein HypA/HybF
MHELSIAQYLIQLVDRHLPDEGQVQSIHIKAGPLQLIDINALEWAWESVAQGTDYAGTHLEIEQLPWTLHCPQCEATWESDDLYETCTCGSHNAYPQAGDDLLLDSIHMANETTHCAV